MSAIQQTFSFAAPGAKPQRRNLVIEAGAGTGKTTAIVAEVLRLLLSDAEADPERIVLVTFTEKAAGEIADRIHSALTELSLQFDAGQSPAGWPIGSDYPLLEIPQSRIAEYRAVCAKHLGRIDALRSQTIHSFCQGLLRQYAIEAGLDPQFRVIEGFERAQFCGGVYDAWIDDETRVRQVPEAVREWEVLLEHTGYLFLAQNLIFNLLDRRDLLLDPTYTTGEIGELEPSLLDALKILRDAQADTAIVRYIRATPAPLAGSSIDEWIDYFAPIAPQIRNENLRDASIKAAMKVLRAGDKKGDSIYDYLVSHRASVALLSLTRRYIARLDAEKRARGVLDFDDLLILTLRLLEDSDVLDRIRRQFDFLFVDEFQDTDRIQARIIDRLARGSSENYEPGKTIVVGDPKQSIYGFRRADPELYDKMTRALIDGGAERRVLDKQYRSEPPLLTAINHLFPTILSGGDPDPNVFRPAYHPLIAARANEHHDDAAVTLLGCACEESEDRYAREAEVIADWVEGRLAADRAKSHSTRYRRFAILFRRLTHIDAYLDVFDRRFPYVLPPTRVFLDRPAPVDLLAVLRAIAYPTDRGAEISAARSPYFALTDSEVVAAGDAWGTFMGNMRDLRSAARHCTVSQLIDLIIDSTDIEDVYRACADGGRSLRHLQHVRAIAFDYDQTTGGSVRQFVDEIARRRSEPDEVEPALFDETKDAVRILTVHGAKGLEFETVIIPDMQFPAPGADAFTVDDPRSLVLRNGIHSLSGFARFSGNRPLREIGGLRDDAETRRLFYVAVTRARRDVAFLCNISKPRREGFAKYLAEVLQFDASMWPADPGRVVTHLGEIPVAFERTATASAGTRPPRLLDSKLEAELAAANSSLFAVRSLSTSVTTATEERFTANAAQRAAGILLHRVLERWDGAAPFGALLAALAAEQATDRDVVARVEQRLTTIGSSAMLRRIAEAKTVGREMPLSFVDENGAIISKRLDRVIQEDGLDTVVDYKSGEPTADRLEGDRQQVALYCAAMQRLTGRPHRGVLWYIDDQRDVTIEV